MPLENSNPWGGSTQVPYPRYDPLFGVHKQTDAIPRWADALFSQHGILYYMPSWGVVSGAPPQCLSTRSILTCLSLGCCTPPVPLDTFNFNVYTVGLLFPPVPLDTFNFNMSPVGLLFSPVPLDTFNFNMSPVLLHMSPSYTVLCWLYPARTPRYTL
jgi:hypothetical protein